MMQREQGFTLVEVVASLVIIGIVLLGVAQLMIQSNDAAAINNEKLVAIDLADTVLQRLKAESHVVKGVGSAVDTPIPLDSLKTEEIVITTVDGNTLFSFNGQQYLVEASIAKCPDSVKSDGLSLRNVKVIVNRVQVKDGTIIQLPGKSEIEGYVEL